MHQKKQLNVDEIVKLLNRPLVKDEYWYLLDKKWFDACKSYHETGDEDLQPGPIDNSALFDDSDGSSTKVTPSKASSNGFGATDHNKPNTAAVSIDSRPLKEDLSEAAGHFVVVPEELWSMLKEAHGLVNPSHTVKRRVIEAVPGHNIVEINLIQANLCLYGGKESNVTKCYSKMTTLQEVQQDMRQVFNVSPNVETKLWVSNLVVTFKPTPPTNGSDEEQKPAAPKTIQDIVLDIIKEDLRSAPPPTPTSNSTTTNATTITNNNNSSNNNTNNSPTVITRQAADSMNKSMTLRETTPSKSSNLSTSTSDSLIGSSCSSSPATTTGSTTNTKTAASASAIVLAFRDTSVKTDEDHHRTTLLDAGVATKTIITLEVANADGTWPSSRPRFVSTRSSKAQPGLCGLSNMGNTCFMNAALQCLSNTPPLTNYILTDKIVDDINPNNPLGMHGEIARTYAELIKTMWSGNHTCFLPREFKCAVGRFAPQFIGFSQQDTQELMAFLLDGLHEDLNRIRNKPYIEIKNEIETRPDEVVAEESWSNYKKRNDSIVVDTFHALLKSTLVCPGCNLVSVTFDPFCYLSLPMPSKRDRATVDKMAETNSVSKQGDERSLDKDSEMMEPEEVKPKPTLQLDDCIGQFTKVERLGAEDPWYCPRCKKHQQATKKFDIWSLPKVLIIHLKRFSFSRSWRDKIDTLVEFPVEGLDMSKYVLDPKQRQQQKQIYNLIGVANHFGGLGGGHYTAYAKNSIQNAWYSFDDGLVTQTSSNNVVTRSAYVLFYQRADTD